MITKYEDALDRALDEARRANAAPYLTCRLAFKAGAKAGIERFAWTPGGTIDGVFYVTGGGKTLAEALAELEDEPEQEKEA